jgi:hypothetical protein
MSLGWRASWVHGAFLDHEGVNHRLIWKVCIDALEAGWWQAREVLTDLKQLAPGQYLHKWWYFKKDVIESSGLALGLTADDMIKASQKSKRARLQRSGDADEACTGSDCRQEWMISSAGMLVIMMVLATTSRKLLHKHAAEVHMNAFLGAMLPADCVSTHDLANVSIAIVQQCPMINGQAHCLHMEELLQELRDMSAPEQYRLARALRAAGPLMPCCPAVTLWLRSIIKTIADDIDKAVEGKRNIDDALYVRAATQHIGRRRVDEDVKHEITTSLIASGRASNSRDAARFLRISTASAASKWDENEVLVYQATCWQSCVQQKSFSVALDGKRLGQPCEETEVYACWVYPGDKAMWLPPMVPILYSNTCDVSRHCGLWSLSPTPHAFS